MKIVLPPGRMQDDAWLFYPPGKGWLVWVADESKLLVWDGVIWAETGGGAAGVNPSPLIGVNSTADTLNRLSVSSANTLFSHEGADHRIKVNKASSSDTASVLFQDNYSGRAEFGLTGDDDFHMKVSPDGSTFFDAILIDKDSGSVSFPNSTLSGGRELLGTDRTYYVNTSGSDDNDGLSAGAAFANIQKAIDVAAGLDMSIFNVTIRLADGTYATDQTLKTYLGAGSITLEGNTANPDNVVIDAPGSAFSGAYLGTYKLCGMKLTAASYGIYLKAGTLEYESLNFGSCSLHVISSGADITMTGDCGVSGGAGRHLFASGPGSIIRAGGHTLTLTGNPAFSTAFVHAEEQGQVRPTTLTFVGNATGKRFISERLGLVQTNGQSTSYLPGDTAGTQSQGGLYT